MKIGKTNERGFDLGNNKPIIPEAINVDLCEWDTKAWKGKKFINVKFSTSDGPINVLLWPNEANCLMDMIKRSLDGVDISYDLEQAYKDLTDSEKK